LDVKYENSFVQAEIERLRTDMNKMSVHTRNRECELLRAEDDSRQKDKEVERLVIALQQKEEELQRERTGLIEATAHIVLKDSCVRSTVSGGTRAKGARREGQHAEGC
jgi:hypothetical protein